MRLNVVLTAVLSCWTMSLNFLRGYWKKEFGVKVRVHNGSVLSPLLFSIVLEALARMFN
jgi:hypothetical protein